MVKKYILCALFGLLFSCTASITCSEVYNTYGAYHRIDDRSPQGDSITTEDGAIYTVDQKFHQDVAKWKKKSSVFIVPRNFFWESINPLNWNLWGNNNKSYMYEMFYIPVGAKSFQSAFVSLSLGPIKSSPFRRCIQAIDRQNRIIYLNNKTQWEVVKSWNKRDLLLQYEVDDAIIVAGGINKEYALINVSDNSYVTVIPLK